MSSKSKLMRQIISKCGNVNKICKSPWLLRPLTLWSNREKLYKLFTTFLYSFNLYFALKLLQAMRRTSLWTKRHNGSFAGSRTDLWFKRLLHLLCLLHLPLHFHHVEPLRCRHHGQLWLPHQVPAFDVSNSSTVYSFIVTRLDICSTFM